MLLPTISHNDNIISKTSTLFSCLSISNDLSLVAIWSLCRAWFNTFSLNVSFPGDIWKLMCLMIFRFPNRYLCRLIGRITYFQMLFHQYTIHYYTASRISVLFMLAICICFCTCTCMLTVLGKADIEKFQASNPTFTQTWQSIRTKIINDRANGLRRAEKRFKKTLQWTNQLK